MQSDIGIAEELASVLTRAGADLDRASKDGLALLCERAGAAGGWLRLWDENAGLYRRVAAFGVGTQAPETAALNEAERENFARGIALSYRLPDQVTGPATRMWAEAGYGGVALFPLVLDTRPQGILSMLFDHAVSDAWVQTMELLRPLLTALLHEVRLLDVLRQNHEQSLRVLGLVLEYRDYDSKGHTDRVAELSIRFGRALELSDDDLRDLRWSGYLHDIGKIAIPDAILCKPGRLDEQEWARMREHSAIGEEFAAKLEFISLRVRDVIRHHHERWDGTGYPDGLAGDQIPLFARIFALVDVFDALITERPYKEAWPLDRALDEIASDAGSAFDPQLTEHFLALVNSAPED